MRLLPPANIPSHSVFVSIALHGSTKPVTPALDEAEQQLVRLFDKFAVPATWGLADPVSELAEQIRASGVSHEIGLRIEPHVQSRREILRRLDAPARQGRGISTLVCDASFRGEIGQLLARHGVSIIACNPSGDVQGRNSSPVTTVRFGLWQISAAAAVSNITAGAERRLRRSIDHTAAAGGLMHLTVDAAAVGRSTAAASAMQRLLGHISETRQRGALQVLTAEQIAEEFRRRPSAPAKSILRISASRREAA